MEAAVLVDQVERSLSRRFKELEETAQYNQVKVIKAFQAHRVRDTHFHASSGYGYGDVGRDTLEAVYADIFGAEEGLVRSQIVSGTHAIASCLFAILRPGDHLLSAVGPPYDTLVRAIGRDNPGVGTLIERGIIYEEAELHDQKPDINNIRSKITSQTKMVLIQRSRGYSLRPAVDLNTIRSITETVHSQNPNTIVMVDNCYGEFVLTEEPTICGVDLMAGSLIKNPGGGLAPSGGYIVGRSHLVSQVADYITAPGLGKELGASLGQNRLMYQGLFMAPHTVMQALKGAVLTSAVFGHLGLKVMPQWDEERSDIVQAVILNDAEQVRKFCQIVQQSSPVDSDLRLEYADMPGYQDKVIMAAGTFVQGSSIELSCDAPMRPPYAAFLQGGLTYEHVRFVVEQLINGLIINKGGSL